MIIDQTKGVIYIFAFFFLISNKKFIQKLKKWVTQVYTTYTAGEQYN